MAYLNITSRALAYEDPNASNNPQLRPFDWTRQLLGVPVDNPGSFPYTIQPLTTQAVFNGTRTLTYDGTTQFALSAVVNQVGRYRLAYTGTGTAPGFRTARTVASTGGTITVTPQITSSVVFTSSLGAVFGSVTAGDIVYIPGVSTGDSSVFDPMNEGYWSVLLATSTAITAVRMPGTVFSVKGQTVSITNNSQFQAFSSSGVQVDDVVVLNTSFPISVLNSYEIVSVTAGNVEFLSGQILPSIATIVPGVSSVVVYSDAKNYLGIESNQNIGLFINGSVTQIPIIPLLPGDPDKIGFLQMLGTTIYSLSIINNSTQLATVRISSAE
jgi:hypothetical protein